MKQEIRSQMLGFGMLLAMLSPVVSAPREVIYHPKPGSGERKAIFNALRVPVGKSVGAAVIFQGNLNASKSGWAFFSGGALLDNGGDGTPIDDGGSGGEMVALLRLKSGRWRVLSWGFGGGMDATEEAMKKYPQAPRGVFRNECVQPRRVLQVLADRVLLPNGFFRRYSNPSSRRFCALAGV